MQAYPQTYCREEARRFFLKEMRDNGGAEDALERIGIINNANVDLAVLEADMNQL